MDELLPHYQHPDPRNYTNDGSAFIEPAEEPRSETLMEALAEHISINPATEQIEGCANDFQLTETVLQRHGQSEMAPHVLGLLRAQGASCDCEVLLNSRIDLVFLESDLDEIGDEDEDEEAETR